MQGPQHPGGYPPPAQNWGHGGQGAYPVPGGSPPYPQGQAPKKNRGCMIVIWIFTGLFVLGLIGGGVAFYRAYQNPDVRKVMKAVGKGVTVLVKARGAPGMKALRKVGCKEPMSLDVQEFAEIGEQLDPSDEKDTSTDVPNLLLVFCPVGILTTPPNCDNVAKAYFRTVSQTDRNVFITVQKQQASEPVCQELYGPDGAIRDRPNINPPMPTPAND